MELFINNNLMRMYVKKAFQNNISVFETRRKRVGTVGGGKPGQTSLSALLGSCHMQMHLPHRTHPPPYTKPRRAIRTRLWHYPQMGSHLASVSFCVYTYKKKKRL